MRQIEEFTMKSKHKLLRKTFFDKIEELIPYPTDWVTRKEFDYFDLRTKKTSDYSFGVANGEMISLTIDFPGEIFFSL